MFYLTLFDPLHEMERESGYRLPLDMKEHKKTKFIRLSHLILKKSKVKMGNIRHGSTLHLQDFDHYHGKIILLF